MDRAGQSSGAINTLLALLAAAGFLGAVVAVDRAQPPAADPVAGRGGPTPEEELARKQESRTKKIAARLAALEEARSAGTSARNVPPPRRPRPAGPASSRSTRSPMTGSPPSRRIPSAPYVYDARDALRNGPSRVPATARRGLRDRDQHRRRRDLVRGEAPLRLQGRVASSTRSSRSSPRPVTCTRST